MRVAVIGSRSFTDKQLLYETLDKINANSGGISFIVSGGAKGADTLSEEYAQDKGIKTQIFRPDYARFGRGAPLKRNLTIVENCDMVVAFWDGSSKGTQNAIDHARKLGKRVEVVKFS